MDWTEKYRPRGLREVVGNGPAVAKVRAWAEAWTQGVPERRALVLAGPPGTGKTSTALALAADMGWPAIELNASDARNAATIRKVATAGAIHQTFSADGAFHAAGSAGADGGRKLIILDEADNLYERLGEEGKDAGGSDLSDRGGKAQIIETIRQTRQPILLIVNDLYALEKGSGSALRSLTETVKFTRLQARAIAPALERVVRAEGIEAGRDVLEAVAAKAEGDLRAALRDLESLCWGRKKVALADLAGLGARDTAPTMFDLVRHILKGRRLEEVRRETWDVDATPEDIVMWVDENLPREYRDPADLARGYDALSRADVFLGRTRSTQDYGLWAYASELGTLGVMVARQKEYRDFVPFGFPQYLLRMSRTRGMRQTKDRLAEALGHATHQSKRKARSEQAETVAALFSADREFAVRQAFELGLEDEEVALLLGDKANAKEIQAIRAEVQALEAAAESQVPAPARRAFDGPEQEEEEAEATPAPERPTPGAGQRKLF